jgi:hypothetical protein
MKRNLHNSHKIPQVRKPKKIHANAAEMKELPGELEYIYTVLELFIDKKTRQI